MKATVATLALVGAASAQSAGATAKTVIGDITTAIGAFDTAVKGYTSGPTTALTAASKKINEAVTSGAAKISGGEQLAITDATTLVTAVNQLQTALDTSLSDLEGKSKALVSSGGCADIISQLQAQGKAATTLQDAVTQKAPAGTQTIAQSEGAKVGASINKTLGTFQTACKGAPAGGASSGSSSAGAAAPAAPAAPAAGSASSGSVASAPAAPSKGDTATATYGGGAEEPATSSTAPSPATYTGSAANIRVGSGLTLAAVAAFWAL